MTAIRYREPDYQPGLRRWTTFLRCDGLRPEVGVYCHETINGRASETRPYARSIGWQITRDGDFCPKHRTDR